MAKVIVERPRIGSRTATSDDPKGWQKRVSGKYADLEDMPFRESMGKKYRSGWEEGKQLNENLSPLKRFLMKSVGRPWDKVYSEICERINVNSAVQAHIRQHVYDFVEKNTFMQDGRVFYNATGYKGGPTPIEESFDDLYVNPQTKLLCKNKNKTRKNKNWWKQNQKKDEPTFYHYGEYAFSKKEGIWYILTMKRVPDGPYMTDIPNHPRNGTGSWRIPTAIGYIKDEYMGNSLAYLMTYDKAHMRHVYGSTEWYCARHKQANSMELKRHGLKNDRPKE